MFPIFLFFSSDVFLLLYVSLVFALSLFVFVRVSFWSFSFSWSGCRMYGKGEEGIEGVEELNERTNSER